MILDMFLLPKSPHNVLIVLYPSRTVTKLEILEKVLYYRRSLAHVPRNATMLCWDCQRGVVNLESNPLYGRYIRVQYCCDTLPHSESEPIDQPLLSIAVIIAIYKYALIVRQQHSMGSEAGYSLKAASAPRAVVGRGIMHMEANYGESFPTGWVWAQVRNKR